MTPNNAFQPTTPLRGGSLAVLGAAERERYARLNHMFRLVLACAVLMPPMFNAHAADAVGTQCVSSCEALKARLAKLNCKEALAETSSYLAANRQIVENFPEELRKNRDAVTAFAAGVEHAMRIAQDCLVKEKAPSRALVDAYLGVNEFRDYVVNWINEKPRVPPELEKDFQARLLKTHAKAVNALALGSTTP